MGRVDFRDTRTIGCFVLTDGFPGNGAAGATYEITREGSKFKEFKGIVVRHGISELISPAGVTKGG